MVKRIEKIENDLNQNKNDLDKINKINILVNAENLQKKIIEIPILVNYLLSGEEGGGGEGG